MIIGEEIKHNKFGLGIVKSIKFNKDNTIISINFKDIKKEVSLDLITANKFITRFSEFCNYDNQTNDWYNAQGYNREGFDKYGFDIKGINKRGFYKNGIHHFTGTHFDTNGYDKQGYNQNGFDLSGIHKVTGEIYDGYGFDQRGNHNSEGIIKTIHSRISPFCEMSFDGFYHMTHFDNAASILKAGKLYSRSKSAMLYDMNSELKLTSDILSQTDLNIQSYVRLYFRTKTPTFWHFENKRVVLLKFNKHLVTSPNAKISIGRAGKKFGEILDSNEINIKKINFNLLYLSSAQCDEVERNIRQTELLIPNEIDLKFLEKIYFKNSKDMIDFKNKYGHFTGITYDQDKTKFFKG